MAPRLDQALTDLSVAALARYEAQLAGVYADSRDRWAFLDLTGQWPQDRGQSQPHLAALASWVSEQVAGELGA